MKTKILKILFLSVIVTIMFSCDDSLTIDQEDSSKRKPLKVEKIDAGLDEWTGNVPDPCKQVCLVAGQHMYVGTVDVAEVNDGLLITYNVTEPGVYLIEVHLDIFNNEEDFKEEKKVSNGGAIPGKFEYKESWSANDMITSHSVLIPTSYIDQYIDDLDCIYIASHAALSNGETAWGGLCDTSQDPVNLNEANQFEGNNWSVYFKFCFEECSYEKDFTYAWEDLRNTGNDGDYNDLVIQSNVIKSKEELTIKFFASARGADFDHQFKFRIPKEGIDDIFGAYDWDIDPSDSDYYVITVWESTQAELPAEGFSSAPFAANTVDEDDTCDPKSSATITLEINSSFIFNENKPYEPLITVFPYSGSEYDLYIYEISGRDTWFDSGKEYPNGIVIPMDWNWPLERTFIGLAYPDFKSITDGWNASWADNEDSTYTFSCTD